jgi:hypothetical protein
MAEKKVAMLKLSPILITVVLVPNHDLKNERVFQKVFYL